MTAEILPWAGHQLTLADWEAMPEDEQFRLELVEGLLLLAVEVLSDGTRKVDRIHKFAEYAEAGIPRYWIVELDEPASLRAFTLVGSDEPAYELSGESTGPVTLDVAGHPVTVDPSGLTRR